MVVGEPSLMGGEFGDEDERLITRLGMFKGCLSILSSQIHFYQLVYVSIDFSFK